MMLQPAWDNARQRLGAARQILGGRDYRLLFAGQAVSQFGDWMNRVALLVIAYRVTGQGLTVALLLLSQLLPRVIITPFGGLLADRYPKRRLLLLTDLLRALLAISFVFVDSARDLWWAAAVVLLMHSMAAVFNPARGAALPMLVPREGLALANALNDMSGQAAFFLGPALGGLLVAAWGVEAVFALNAATFLFSSLLIWLMRLPEPPRQGIVRRAVLDDLREGWAAVAGVPLLRFLCGCLFLQAAVAIGLTVLLLPLLTGPLGQQDGMLGTMMTCVGLGTLLGTIPALWLFGRYPTLPLAALVVGGVLLTMALIGVAPSVVFIGIALLANGFLSTCIELITLTTVQRTVAGDRLGRAIGLMFWVLALGQVLGAIGGSVLLLRIDVQLTILILSGIFALILLILLFATLGRMRAMPPTATP